MSPVIPIKKLARFFVVFPCFFFLIFSGCSQKETPKKVSLYERTDEALRETDNVRKDILQFGFDLRFDPKEDVRIYTPFLKYLEKTTGKRFRIKFNKKYEDTIASLGNGTTHFGAIGPLSYVIGREKYGYGIRYLVSGVNKEGDPRSHAVIFTSPESTLEDIKNLKGKCFAFGPRISTQGHLIPRKMLEDAGITLQDLGDYVYTGSHMNTVKSVLNGECNAGGIQDTLAESLAEEGKIKILKISKPYPSSLIAYNGAVEAKTVEAVRSALLDFEPMTKHKDTLVHWDKTEMALGFTPVNENELYKVAVLARKYGLLTK
ncbi:MAG: PhnD/SsuA/transferrin family substrate-binding protein [Thermodesulfovibrionia bacterium]|nr:PhnD/SsuA/transferrin family substrate-binding protein [Thermodesulfovibrionia bacterium]